MDQLIFVLTEANVALQERNLNILESIKGYKCLYCLATRRVGYGTLHCECGHHVCDNCTKTERVMICRLTGGTTHFACAECASEYCTECVNCSARICYICMDSVNDLCRACAQRTCIICKKISDTYTVRKDAHNHTVLCDNCMHASHGSHSGDWSFCLICKSVSKCTNICADCNEACLCDGCAHIEYCPTCLKKRVKIMDSRKSGAYIVSVGHGKDAMDSDEFDELDSCEQ